MGSVMDSTYFILFKYAIGIDNIDPRQWVLQGAGLILLTVKLFWAIILHRNTALNLETMALVHRLFFPSESNIFRTWVEEHSIEL